MNCVFISHSSKDANVAKALCHQLEEAGVRCWMAPRDITPGVPWSGQITGAIREAAVFVLVFSQHSNKSEQVLNELDVANKYAVPILPFRIEDIEPSGALEYYVGARHWLDALTPPLQAHGEKLREAVVKIIALRTPVGGESAVPPKLAAGSREETTAHRKSAPPAKARFHPAWIAVAVVAVVAGVLALMMRKENGPAVPGVHRSPMPAVDGGDAARKGPRKALVVGVNDYRALGMEPLKNAMNDARLMRQTLEKCGFSVEVMTNPSLHDLTQELKRFSNELRPGDDTVIYFSGQGLEEGRDLFLLTSDFKARSRSDLYSKGLHVNTLLQSVAPNGDGLKLLILDCCRTAPFAPGSRDSGAQPLPALPPRPDVRSLMIVHATGVGKKAYDSGGKDPNNSPFTQALCEAMLHPGWTLEQVVRDAAESTVRQTGGLQRPEVGDNNLTTPYMLQPAEAGER